MLYLQRTSICDVFHLALGVGCNATFKGQLYEEEVLAVGELNAIALVHSNVRYKL